MAAAAAARGAPVEECSLTRRSERLCCVECVGVEEACVCGVVIVCGRQIKQRCGAQL